MLTLAADTIPKALQTIPDPPTKLYVVGDTFQDLIAMPSIAVVGSRRVSQYGRHVTDKLASELADKGVCIVSGLALGVDSIAHLAALKVNGKTIAVLPGGIARIYPRSHESLGKAIIKNGGALISERPGSESPRNEDFLIRNRLVAGLGDAVLITEAAERSGSLNTARHALDQGKTVFAVPGNITSELSAGTNALIKAGAVPVTKVDDIFHALNWEMKAASTELFRGSETETIIVKLLRDGITSGEELLIASGLPKSSFTEALTMLEISGVIRPLGANQWALC